MMQYNDNIALFD